MVAVTVVVVVVVVVVTAVKEKESILVNSTSSRLISTTKAHVSISRVWRACVYSYKQKSRFVFSFPHKRRNIIIIVIVMMITIIMINTSIIIIIIIVVIAVMRPTARSRTQLFSMDYFRLVRYA